MSDAVAVKTDLPQETLEYFGGDDLRAHVFYDKYALREPGSNGQPGRLLETAPPQMWERIAREIASVERTPELRQYWQRNFYWLLDEFRFVPGGRIMHGAGNLKGRVTLLNCYVIPHQADSIEAIYHLKAEMARTYSSGGGVGIDISILRPRGGVVHNASSTSSGAVSYMEEYSLTTGTIGQDGRRGALMITIADWHPDVLEFATIKTKLTPQNQMHYEAFVKDLSEEHRRIIGPVLEKALTSGQVRYANISVRLSDTLMRAVENDETWSLRFPDYEAGMAAYQEHWTGDLAAWERKELPVRTYKTIKARDLWNLLIKGARDYAEPGCLFWDTTKRFSTSEYNGMDVITTNPCAEIPLEPYGNCCLGNVNLPQFVTDQFAPTAHVVWESLERALRYATRFLDNVLDYNADKHPLDAQAKASLYSRRIGVGFTGLGDMLIKLGLKYDTNEAVQFVDGMFDRIKNIVYYESVNLAVEKGVFPAYDPEKHWFRDGAKHPFLETLHPDVWERGFKHGLRNVALLTVPPVGSGASLAGVTSGVEPIFDLTYTRRSESLSAGWFYVTHPLLRDYFAYLSKGLPPSNINDENPLSKREIKERQSEYNVLLRSLLPDTWVTSHQINPEMRVKMQAAIQRHIDHSISSTINLPEDISVEKVKEIYSLAWEKDCKGVTVYRAGSREDVLTSGGRPEGVSKEETNDDDPLTPRPVVLEGNSYRLVTPAGSVFIAVNHNGGNDPMEVFVDIGKAGSDLKAMAEAIGRVISTTLRLKPNVSRRKRAQLLAEQLSDIGGRSSVGFGPNRIKSVPDAISKALRLFLGEDSEQADPPLGAGSVRQDESTARGPHFDLCPRCKEFGLINENGCSHCISCGYDEC